MMLNGEKTGASYHLKSTMTSDYLSGARHQNFGRRAHRSAHLRCRARAEAGARQPNGSRVSPPAVRRWIRSPARTRIISAARGIPNHRRDDTKHKSQSLGCPAWLGEPDFFFPASAGRPLASSGGAACLPACQPQYSSCSVELLGARDEWAWQMTDLPSCSNRFLRMSSAPGLVSRRILTGDTCTPRLLLLPRARE